MRFFDLHSDTPYRCYTENLSFWDKNLAVSAEKGKNLEAWRQCFAVWVSEAVENPYEFYKKVLCDFKEKIKNKPRNLTPHLTLEGGSLIDSTERLYELKADGIRAITLTWNGENLIAGGVKSQKGLTDFGVQVINKMNGLKIACDLSHINKKSFFMAAETADYPLATHSNCSAVFSCPRNLTDEQIKLIAEKNGIIGLCFYPEFLGGDVFENLYRNVFYLLDKGYEDIVAIGSDFDGADMDKRLDGTDKIIDFYRFLERKGIEKALLDKIFYSNAVKFFDKTVGMI